MVKQNESYSAVCDFREYGNYFTVKMEKPRFPFGQGPRLSQVHRELVWFTDQLKHNHQLHSLVR